MKDASVVTLSQGRPGHLHNVVLGLCRQTVLPRELIVAVMQDTAYDLPASPFPVRQIMVRQAMVQRAMAGGGTLPLAFARNLAARAADGEALVFLDMDCIPAPTLIEDYSRGLAELTGC